MPLKITKHLYQYRQQMLLGRVMEGQIAGADAQRVTDLLDGGICETLLQKQTDGNLDDFFLCGVQLFARGHGKAPFWFLCISIHTN